METVAKILADVSLDALEILHSNDPRALAKLQEIRANLNSPVEIESAKQIEETKSALKEHLESWKERATGENREGAAESVLTAYDEFTSNRGTDKRIELNLSIFPELTEMPPLFNGISALNISKTKITELPKELSNLESLKHLAMFQTSIEVLPALPKGLQYLNVSHTALTALPELNSLEVLDISYTKLQGSMQRTDHPLYIISNGISEVHIPGHKTNLPVNALPAYLPHKLRIITEGAHWTVIRRDVSPNDDYLKTISIHELNKHVMSVDPTGKNPHRIKDSILVLK